MNKSNPKKVIKTIPKTSDLLKRTTLKSLPSAVAVEKFAQVRSLEILAFQNAIKSAAAQGSSRVFQSLPRHLRRRAASHNPRRVPKRLRSRAAAEIDPGDHIAKIHRKRALRRRIKQSRTEQLQQRQKNKSWLATHIYHAKRFHMVDLWEYRLGLTPTLKSFRPAYRASRHKAIVHDATYFGVIELEGSRGELLGLLGKMTGGPFAGSRYECGHVETVLYHPDSFPLGMIGPASVIWRPDSQCVWLRLHPSIYTETWEAINTAIAQGSSSELFMRDLRHELGAFEVVGPEGGKLIRRVLRGKKGFDLGDPATMSGQVLGVEVYDPRLNFPPVEKAGSARSNNSDLWNSEMRNRPQTFKKSDLDQRRHKLGLPGTKLRPTAQDDRFPVLIITTERTHTILFPRVWSNPILQSIVYTGTLIGGLDQRRAQHREAGIPCFPEHFGSVCKAGREWEYAQSTEDQARWARKPSGKRNENPGVWKPDWNVWLFPRILYPYISQADRAVNAFRKERGMRPLRVEVAGAVVHVMVEPNGRGSPERMAELYHGDTVIGYTTTGNFSLARGNGYALGAVRLEAWVGLEEDTGGRLVEFRNKGGVRRSARVRLV